MTIFHLSLYSQIFLGNQCFFKVSNSFLELELVHISYSPSSECFSKIRIELKCLIAICNDIVKFLLIYIASGSITIIRRFFWIELYCSCIRLNGRNIILTFEVFIALFLPIICWFLDVHNNSIINKRLEAQILIYYPNSRIFYRYMVITNNISSQRNNWLNPEIINKINKTIPYDNAYIKTNK